MKMIALAAVVAGIPLLAQAQSLMDAYRAGELDAARQQLQADRDSLRRSQILVPYDAMGRPRPTESDQFMIDLHQRALNADLDRIDGLLRDSTMGR